MDRETKSGLIHQFQHHANDTGSTEVQVALLTERISALTAHLQQHRKDFHTRRGLQQLVGQRRRLLTYLSREDTARYQDLLAKLGLRK